MAAPWQLVLTDIKTDTALMDVSNIALSWTISPRLNRPLSHKLNVSCADPALHAVWSDGDPLLYPGSRAIKAYRNGVLRGHTIIWNLTYQGGADRDPSVQVTAIDPMIRFTRRHAFDFYGHLIDPIYDNPITGGQLLRNAISYSRTYEDNFGIEALLPVDTFTGIDTTTVNLYSVIADGPITLADLTTALTDTGKCDIVLAPVDSSSAGAAAGIMARLETYDGYGNDRSASIDLRYGMLDGTDNCAAASRVLDMSTVGNRITFELGPKDGNSRFKGNITGTETGAAPGSEDLTAWQAQALLSRAKFGTFADVQIFDEDGDAESRVFFHQLWKHENELRWNPRDLLQMVPQAGLGLDPFDGFHIGDIVAVNTGYYLGRPIANGRQRIYGYDVAWSNEDPVERVTQLIVSADAEESIS